MVINFGLPTSVFGLFSHNEYDSSILKENQICPSSVFGLFSHNEYDGSILKENQICPTSDFRLRTSD